jgi:peptidyl-prolyl cis-trans isomerase SurA
MRTLFISITLVVAALPAVAQQPVYEPVDRILAIVGRQVITETRLLEELNVFRQQGGEVPTEPEAYAAFRREILDRMVDEELLVQAAERDTLIVVSEQELQAAVEPVLRQVRSQFASEIEYERNLRSAGFASPDDYRRWMTDQKRRELLRDQFISLLTQRGDIAPLPPTERELREYFDETREQRPQRPPTMSFRQIVVRSRPDSAEMERAFLLADSLGVVLRARTADFGTVARRFSQDPGSAEQGGEMGWVRRGQGLVREFEDAVFRLRPGFVSPPVLTAFGFHLIEVLRAQPAEALVRHILIAPEITDLDKAAALQQAMEIRDSLQAGFSFDALARVHHDPLEQRVIEDASVQDLPQVYAQELGMAAPNTILGPIELDRGDGRPKFAVVLFEEMRPGGDFTFEDVRDVLRETLSQQNGLRRFLDSLRRATFVDVRL